MKMILGRVRSYLQHLIEAVVVLDAETDVVVVVGNL